MFTRRLPHVFDKSWHSIVNLLIFFIWVKSFTKDCNPMIKFNLIKNLYPSNCLSKREVTELLSMYFEQMVCVRSYGILEMDIS